MNQQDKKEILRVLFNTIDPVGIFYDQNFDEYDPEIDEFLKVESDLKNEEEIYQTLIRIFAKFFEGINFDREKIRILANQIYLGPYTIHEIGCLHDDKSTNEWVLLTLEITFDGVKTGYIFDCAAFVASVEKDGVFPIVVCGCDYIGCSGMYVRVVHRGGYVYWTEFYNGQADTENFPEEDQLSSFVLGNRIKPPVVFLADNYKKLANDLEKFVDSYKNPEYKKYFIQDLERYREGKDLFRP